jgi:WD40 repeat protein
MTGRRPAIFQGRGEMKFKEIIFSVACLLLSGSIAADAQQKNALVWIQRTADAATHRAAIAFSSDGQFVASGRADSNSVQIWNAANGTLLRTLTGQNNNANILAFSPDSQYLVSGTGQPGQGLSLNLWRVADGARLVGRIAAFTNGTISVSFSSDGQYLAATGFHATGYKIYHIPDMSLVGEFGNFDPELGYNVRMQTLAFAPDGRTIAIGDTRGIRIRNVADGSLVTTINTNAPSQMSTFSLDYASDGRTLLAGVTVHDPTYAHCIDCSIKLFDVATGALLHQYTGTSFIDYPRVKFSTDGRTVGAGFSHNTDNGGSVEFWDLDSGRVLREDSFPWFIWDFDYSPLGSRYAFFSADGSLGVSQAPETRNEWDKL